MSRIFCHNLKNSYLIVMVLILFLTVGCSKNKEGRSIDVLRVAVLPDQSAENLRHRYLPLLEHIKSYTGMEYKLLIPESYDQLLEWFVDKKIDIARFGGVTYIKAHARSKADPLVMRDIDGHFRSVLLVHVKNPAKRLQDIKGASFSFGSRLSTSGHFMPRYFFQKKNISPETYFNHVQYSGSHDRTAEWVRDGKVEAGVANSEIINNMFKDGRLTKDKVKIIWESPAYADYVWAIQPDMTKAQRTKLRDAFLHMHQHKEDKKILVNLGANYYIPAGHSDFIKLEQTVRQMDARDSK